MSHPPGNLAAPASSLLPLLSIPGSFLPTGTSFWEKQLSFPPVNGKQGLCPAWGWGVCLDPTQPLPPVPPKICVEKCPDRYLTYLNAHTSQDFEYYKQFCVPGFQSNKV